MTARASPRGEPGLSGFAVAVDCGGTSSRAVLLADGAVRARFDGAATLSGCLDPVRIGEAMRTILDPIESRCRSEDLVGSPVTVVIAAAGFVDSLRDDYRRAVQTVMTETFGGGIETVVVVNDAVALLLGHEAGGVVVAGTGSSVLMRRPDGSIAQYGGHDWVAADAGSAFWVGLDGIRRAARSAGADAESALVQQFCGVYRVGTTEIEAQFRALAVAGPNMKANIARFAVGVCDAAQEGDPDAAAILDRNADELAAAVERGLRMQCDRRISIVECGGLMANALYRNLFERLVRERTDDLDGSIEWVRVPDGLGAVEAIAARMPQWPSQLGHHRPLVVSNRD